MTQNKEIKKIDFLPILRNYIDTKLQIMRQKRLIRRLNKTLIEKFLTEYRNTIRTLSRNYIRGEKPDWINVYHLKCELLNLGVRKKVLDKIKQGIMKEEADIYVKHDN